MKSDIIYSSHDSLSYDAQVGLARDNHIWECSSQLGAVFDVFGQISSRARSVCQWTSNIRPVMVFPSSTYSLTCCPKCRGVSGLDDDDSHVNIPGDVTEKSVSGCGGTTMSITVAATSFFIVIGWTLSSHRCDRLCLVYQIGKSSSCSLRRTVTFYRMIAFGSALHSSVRYSSMPVNFKHSASDGLAVIYWLILTRAIQKVFLSLFHFARTRIAGCQRFRFVPSLARLQESRQHQASTGSLRPSRPLRRDRVGFSPNSNFGLRY